MRLIASNRRMWQVVLVALALLLAASNALAQTGGEYDLTWSTVDGGGGMTSSGGTYTLSGTVGQADAGQMSGGSYGLAGGFWSVMAGYFRYLPLVLR